MHSSTTLRAQTGMGFSSSSNSGTRGSTSCATICARASAKPSSLPSASSSPLSHVAPTTVSNSACILMRDNVQDLDEGVATQAATSIACTECMV